MSADREPRLRARMSARLGPEPLAALLAVGGLILFFLVLVVLIAR